MSNVRKGSILFNKMRQVVARNKSTFVYEADKTFAQRWLQGKVQKIKELQKFHGADDGIPLWWKSTSDKAITTFVFAGTIASFLISATNLAKFATGQL